MAVLGFIDNALLQGFSYGIAVLGVAIAFRCLRFPDLSADGSFVLGSTVSVAALMGGMPPMAAVCIAGAVGALAGVVTGILHIRLGVNRLLAGILTSMASYSVAFHILSGKANVGLLDLTTVFTVMNQLDRQCSLWPTVHPFSLALLAGAALVLAALVLLLLRSDFGLVLRATGANQSLVKDLGRRPSVYQVLGLAVANGLVGISAALVTARQGFTDVNMGIGVIITLIAALVIGEEVLDKVGLRVSKSLSARILAPFVGACCYFALYLLILRASIRGWLPLRIQPTDLKLLSALVVVAVVALRARSRTGDEEVLPI